MKFKDSANVFFQVKTIACNVNPMVIESLCTRRNKSSIYFIKRDIYGHKST